MVSNISSCTKVLVLPIVLWVVSSFSLRAQEKDFATWANAGFEYKLKPAFTVSGGLEWRTKDDLGKKTEHFGVKRMRYRGGITLPLSERWEADIFYCRQWEKDKRKDIVGVECVYSF